MYYSINFTNDSNVRRNTWDSWGLIPTSRPSIANPTIWSNPINISGVNGQVDLVRPFPYPAVNNYVQFRNTLQNDKSEYAYNNYGYSLKQANTGQFSFIIADQDRSYVQIYEDILNYVHNQRLSFVLEDNPSIIYHGRFTVENFQNAKDFSQISFSYTLDPN